MELFNFLSPEREGRGQIAEPGKSHIRRRGGQLTEAVTRSVRVQSVRLQPKL